jgi:hypothetical protein
MMHLTWHLHESITNLKKLRYKMTPFPIPQLVPINVISFSFFDATSLNRHFKEYLVSNNEKFVND